ncbi:holo-ACP synthase [Buchnera aphidicola]|uniref:holo-ACP synthase n=1 Tax=Buchnera aphidicola TaxID=9 RepID=UPI0031B6A7E2
MKIIGIGIDSIEIYRIQILIQKYDMKIPLKILSQKELQNFLKNKKNSYFLAKIFTAKEAFLKALGIGIKNIKSLKNLEISHTSYGKPTIKILNKNFFSKKYKIHLSITDTQKYAQSIVILEA